MTDDPEAPRLNEENSEITIVTNSHDVSDAQQHKRELEEHIRILLNQYQEDHDMKILSINLKRFFSQPEITEVKLIILL